MVHLPSGPGTSRLSSPTAPGPEALARPAWQPRRVLIRSAAALAAMLIAFDGTDGERRA